MKKIIPMIIFITSLIATFALLFKQISSGLSTTGLNEPSVWGVYIASFTFTLGAGAGVLLLISYLSLTNKLEARQLLKLSFTALVFLGLAGIFITLDLGRPEKFYLFLTSANFDSPLVWDFWVMNTLIAISVFLIILGFKGKTLAKPLSIIILILTSIGYFITTEAFSGLTARINWNTPVLNLIFIISAIIAGLSLYLFFSDEDDNFIKTMTFKAALSLLLIIDLALFITTYFNVSNLIIVYLLVGNVIPIIVIFMFLKDNIILKKLVPIWILVSMWFKRSDIIFSGYTNRWLPFSNKTEYIPSGLEKLLVINIFILGVFALIVAFTIMSCKMNTPKPNNGL